MLWQETSNSIWFTDKRPVCFVCGKRTDRVLEIKTTDDDERGTIACFGGNDCCNKVLPALVEDGIEEDDDKHVLTRMIKYKPLFKKQSKGLKKDAKKPVGLSKRYKVLKRDGFQCVKCGVTGKDARLEIDHIYPRSKGGSDNEDNLETLCFACNRGKRDKVG